MNEMTRDEILDACQNYTERITDAEKRHNTALVDRLLAEKMRLLADYFAAKAAAEEERAAS